MSEKKQPGVEVDADLWEKFRNDIEARKGTVRGHLKTELENALREYMGDGELPTARMVDNRLSRIENHMGISGTDGGVDTVQSEKHTHAPNRLEYEGVDTKPSANAATEKKVAYLAGCVRDEAASDGQLREVGRPVFKDVVKDEYGFRSDTAKRYVAELIDYFNLSEHPRIGEAILVSEDRHAEIIEQEREQRRQEADEKLEER